MAGPRYVLLLLSLFVASISGAATSGGAEIFSANCVVCHGPAGQGIAAMKTPNLADPRVQARLTDEQMLATIKKGNKGTNMLGWEGRLSSQEILLVAAHVRSLGPAGQIPQGEGQAQAAGVYEPGDDFLMSMPTGRPLERHGLYVNFSHRFAFEAAVSGPARGASLAGLDGFSLSSLGFGYGISRRLSVSIYRSPTFIARPIQMMAAYNLLSENGGAPLNATARVSIEGQDNFSRNFAENLELIVSRSLTGRAQVYAAPTVSFNARRLFSPRSIRSSSIPNLPGYNTVSLGLGASVDLRPTLALVAEVIPTLHNGRPLGIHRPAYGFGIQKKIRRHSFTIGLTNSPGTTVSQRAGTRAAFLNDPRADTPRGLAIGFDLTRQLR